MKTQNWGADIQALVKQPSVDLTRLVELLAKAIAAPKPPSASLNPKQRSLFIFDENRNRLRICTSAALLRLFSSQDFSRDFKPSESTGFVRDFQAPSMGLQAKLGGELTEANAAKLPRAVDRLMSSLDRAIDEALPENTDLSQFLLDNPASQLKQLARNIKVSFNQQTNFATLQPLVFDPNTAQKSSEPKPVAKVISAVEQIDADDYFAHMCEAIAQRLQQRDCDENEIDSALESLQAEQDRADSQIARFLKFLDTEALARVRLTIAFRIMEAIAKSVRSSSQTNNQLFVRYADRGKALVEAAKTEGFTVDLTAHYGQNAEFELSEYLTRASFYSCLSVWPEGKAQIFEEKVSSPDRKSYSVQREVSYRFRINGEHPNRKKPAFEARLDGIEEVLLRTEERQGLSPNRLNRRLAELLVLDVVIPYIPTAATQQKDISSTIETRLALLNQKGPEAVREILADLRTRAPAMKAIATALKGVLRSKGHTIVTRVQQQAAQQFICVKRGIVEWERLEGAEPGVRDLLVGARQRAQELVEWSTLR